MPTRRGSRVPATATTLVCAAVTDLARRRVRAGAATAVAQVLVMAGSSLLGLLVARRLGSSGATDGFFAANAVYGIALFTAQSLRTTAPATLIDPGPRALARHARAVGLIALGMLVLFGAVVAGADVVASESAAESLRVALAILAPAAVAQLFSGLLAARCAVLGEFGLPAAAYACGTLVMAAVFVALVGPLGVDAIALSVAIGALISAAAMVVVWRRAERSGASERAVSEALVVVPSAPSEPAPAAGLAATVAEPSVTTPAPVVASSRAALIAHLLRGALPVLASQVVISVSVFAAGHVAVGGGTLYSYGVLAVAVLVAIVASPVSIVLAPEIARGWDRRAATLIPATVNSYRLGALLLPGLAIPVLLVGPAVAEWLLTALSPSDVETAFTVAAVLVPTVLATLLAMVPLVGTVAAGLLSRVGVGVVIVGAVHVPAAALAAATDSILVLSIEGAVAAFALNAVPIWVALRGAGGVLARAVTAATVRYALPGAAVAVAVWLALGAGMELGPNLVAAAAGLAVHLVVAATFGRDDVRGVLGYSSAS
jgi:hypothetical protein